MEKRIPKEERRAYLDTLDIHSLRKIGQAVGVKSSTSLRVEVLKDSILAVEYGEVAPHFTNRGRKRKEKLDPGKREVYFKDNPLSDAAVEHMRTHVLATAHDGGIEIEGDYEGFLERDGSGYVLTRSLLGELPTLLVPASVVQKYDLREGDFVRSTVICSKEGDFVLGKIIAVNGRREEELLERREFAALTSVYPTCVMSLADSKAIAQGEEWLSLADLVCPIGKGSRAVLYSKKTRPLLSAFKRMAKSLQRGGGHLIVYLVDQPPEEVSALAETLDCTLFHSDYTHTDEEHVRLTETAFAHCKRLVESGEDVTLMVHSVSRIVRAYRSYLGGDAKADGAAIHAVKKLFGAARNTKSGGSFTVIATAKQSDSQIDLLLQEELTDFCNTYVEFDDECPTLFRLSASGTENADLLIGEDADRFVSRLKRAVKTESDETFLQRTLQKSCCMQELTDELEQWIKTK
ncbi:MAG: hypothetical protein IIY09_02490 [Clostridia bacterium]|nr:hypothetical protein [Clostridia bacterium]